MEINDAVAALSALAQGPRLAVFRLLVAAGPDGLAAGEIARRTGVAANTLSAQLTVLTQAGLTASRREGRSIIYSADYAVVSQVLAFLMDDCCGGRPEVCAPLAGITERACCAA